MKPKIPKRKRMKPAKIGRRFKARPMGDAYTDAIERAIEMYIRENRKK